MSGNGPVYQLKNVNADGFFPIYSTSQYLMCNNGSAWLYKNTTFSTSASYVTINRHGAPGASPEGSIIYQNGALNHWRTDSATFTDGQFRIGIRDTGSAYFDGHIAEIIYYARGLKSDELNSVGYYLGQKYAIDTDYLPDLSAYYVAPGGTGTGTSWGDALGSIQDAVNAAGTGDTIYIKYGTFSVSSGITVSDKTDLTIEGGYQGIGTPGDLTNELSVISRSGGNIRILSITDSTVSVDRVALKDSSFTAAADNIGGAALLMVNADATLSNCELRDNDSVSGSAGYIYGGGVYVSGGSLTMDSCVVSNNHGTVAYFHAGGGGLFAAGATITATDSTFERNYLDTTATTDSRVSYGGGLSIDTAVSFDNCVFKNNYIDGNNHIRSCYGGGLNLSAGGTFTDCEFINNRIQNVEGSSIRPKVTWGGAIRLGGGALTLSGCTIRAT